MTKLNLIFFIKFIIFLIGYFFLSKKKLTFKLTLKNCIFFSILKNNLFYTDNKNEPILTSMYPTMWLGSQEG